MYRRSILQASLLALFTLVSASSAAPWTPAETNTTLWLDAADATTIHTNDAVGFVSQWDDKSGNGYDVVQTNGSYQPVTGTQQINGLNTIKFDGTGDSLIVPINFPASYASFFVCDVTTKYSLIYCEGSNGGTTDSAYSLGTSKFYVDSYQPSGNNGPTTALPVGNTIVSCQQPDKYSRQLYVDGGYYGQVTETASPGTLPAVIGKRGPTATDSANNKFGEIIFCHYAMVESDRQKIEGYLAWKWGMETNLPSGHPYEHGAPRSLIPPAGTVFTIK